MRFSGIFAPATTPFDAVTGDIDIVALRGNVRRLLATELAGVVLFGSTGEGPLLDEEERVAALEGAREVVGEKLLLAGVASESTRQAVRRARQAAGAGADAVMIAPPSYFGPQLTPEALREHYHAVADASPVPVLVYQVPRVYAGADLQSGLVAELSRHGNLVGIKDSTGDLKAMGELVAQCSRDFAIIAGNGAMLYGALEVGAVGGILAIANLAPAECARIHTLKCEGGEAEAGALQERLAPVHRAIVGGFGVPGVKAALDLLGMAGGPPRAPLRALRPREIDAVRQALEKAGVGRNNERPAPSA
ncbi:MAG TPA: dihydrodipicolinate synthase family protein [Longimicrobiaceae bacterium]|nr:dihydrodipicolinate synthase family protein [Longimicrobiaceae bacterium]